MRRNVVQIVTAYMQTSSERTGGILQSESVSFKQTENQC